MPTPRRRSCGNVPHSRTPPTSTFKSCSSCGSRNSIRKVICQSCGSSLRRVTRKLGSYRTRSSVGAMSEGDSQPMETSEPQDMASMAEEGSAASSPHPSHSSHTSPPPTHDPHSSSPPTHTETLHTSTMAGPAATYTESKFPAHENDTHPQSSSDNTPSQEVHPPHGTQAIPPPLPDFLSALKMRPSSTKQTCLPSDSAPKDDVMQKVGVSSAYEGAESAKGGGQGESLLERYRKDPDSVLNLLKSALSLDKLTQMLDTEYFNDTEQLQQLQGKLSAAYQTLKDCAEHKATLNSTIEETNEKIRGKRKHLESLRDDLRVLGEEEMTLKKRRDAAVDKCSQLRHKVEASRQAITQISALAKSDLSQSKDLA